jgi:hypothetical protein
VVAPKDINQTYSYQENQKATSEEQSSLKMHSGKSQGSKKPKSATQTISNKKLDMLLKKMLANDETLSESGKCIDRSIKELQNQIQKSVTMTKAQDNLHKNPPTI